MTLSTKFQPLLPVQFQWKAAPFSSVFYPPIAIVCYLALIFSLQAFMRNRPPVKLRYATFVHNVFLCVLSVAMGAGTLSEVVRMLIRTSNGSGLGSGVRAVLCDPNGSAMTGRMGFWMYVFYVSKFYELVDTLIMVLKKRPLNFLHVYHHSVVLPLFYVYMSTSMVLQWILVVANSFVHVAMYYYYAMAAIGHRVWWKKYITQAQIIQFIIDLTATWPYPALYFSASGCSGSMRAWLFGQAVGLSFFKLFCNFYFKSYTNKAKNLHEEQQSPQPNLQVENADATLKKHQ